MKNKNKKFLLSVLFVSTLFFCGVQEAKAVPYECNSAEECKRVCNNGESGAYKFCWDPNPLLGGDECCTQGYKTGIRKEDEECANQRDCAAGLYCRTPAFESVDDKECKKKLNDGERCESGMVVSFDNCKFGCLTEHYYQGVADADSGAVTYECGVPGERHETSLSVGSGAQVTDDSVPGETVGTSRIVTCGRPGQPMCHLCDLIAGFNNVIQYLMRIAIGIALLAIMIGGVMYIVSAGDTGMMDMAKNAIKNAIIGFILIFTAFLIINTTITYLGAKSNLGINIISWGKFDCTPAAR